MRTWSVEDGSSLGELIGTNGSVGNRVDAGSGADHLLGITEGDREHGADSGVQPPEAGEQAGPNAGSSRACSAGGNLGVRGCF